MRDHPVALAELPGDVGAGERLLRLFRTGTFWHLTSPSGARGHLLGTIHIGEPGSLNVPDQVWTRLAESRRLVVEVVPDAASDREFERGRRLPPRDSLARALNRSELRALRERFSRAGLPVDQPSLYKPWLLAVLLQTASHLPSVTLDEFVVERARRLGVAVRGLETPREQVVAFECIAHDEQVLLLREALMTEIGYFERLNEDALDLYRAQRTGALVDMLIARYPISADARAIDARQSRCLLDERNRRFADRLEAILVEPGVFVAVGAGHLVGPGGVLALLASRGFAVGRVVEDLPCAAVPAGAE